MDVEKFTKLMKMTTSSHDGEALNALRMANAMLSRHKLDWSDITKAINVPTPSLGSAYAGGSSYGAYTYRHSRPHGSWADDIRKATEEFEKAAREAAARKRGRATESDDKRAVLIRKMFAYLRKHLEEGHLREFVANIHVDWRTYHKLDEKQFRGLERVYLKVKKDNGHGEEEE